MIPIRLEWQRCPDGVEETVKSDDDTMLFRAKTTRTVPVVYEVRDLDAPIAAAFINIGVGPVEDEKRRAEVFLSRYGMPTVSETLDTADLDLFRETVGKLAWDEETLPEDVNAFIDTAATFADKIELSPGVEMAGDRMRLILRPANLLALMAMEMLWAAEVGARPTRCEQCEKFYFTGPLTGRRGHSKYCSDRCRVAAMRERNSNGAR